MCKKYRETLNNVVTGKYLALVCRNFLWRRKSL